MEPIPKLGTIPVVRRVGNEMFRDGIRDMNFDVTGFWQWSSSDLISNTTRGILAEFLIAKALGVAEGVREEWAAYDLTAADGTRIEVKSAAYIQSWHQERPSPITFLVPKTRAWDRETNRQSDEVRRQADVYVFALLAHQDQSTLDPLDISQWEFYVVPTLRLDRRTRSQHSIGLRSLKALAGEPVTYPALPVAVADASALQKKLRSEAVHPDPPSAGG